MKLLDRLHGFFPGGLQFPFDFLEQILRHLHEFLVCGKFLVFGKAFGRAYPRLRFGIFLTAGHRDGL
jgi:hypothetical protein